MMQGSKSHISSRSTSLAAISVCGVGWSLYSTYLGLILIEEAKLGTSHGRWPSADSIPLM